MSISLDEKRRRQVQKQCFEAEEALFECFVEPKPPSEIFSKFVEYCIASYEVFDVRVPSQAQTEPGISETYYVRFAQAFFNFEMNRGQKLGDLPGINEGDFSRGDLFAGEVDALVVCAEQYKGPRLEQNPDLPIAV